MSKSLIVNYLNTIIVANLTEYVSITGQQLPTTAEAETEFPIRDAGTLSNLFVDVLTNTITGETSFVLRTNLADTSVSVTYLSSQTGVKEDTTNTATVAATDEVNYKIETGSTGSSIQFFRMAMQFEPDAAGDTISILGTSGGSYNHNKSSQTLFSHMQGSTTVIETTEANEKYRIRGAFTGSNLYAYVTLNSRTTDLIFKTRKNGADGSQSLTYSSGQSGVKEDISGTDSLVAGDDYGFAITTLSGSETFTIRTFIVTLTSTADEFILLAARQFSNSFPAGITSNNAVASILSGIPDESNTSIFPRFAFQAKELSSFAVSNAATADSTITLRDDGVDSTLKVTYTSAQTGLKTDSTNKVAVAPATGGVNYQIAVGTGGSLLLSWIGMLGEAGNTLTADVGAFTLTGIAAELLYSNEPATYIQKITTSDLSPTWPNASEGDYEMSEGTGSDTGIAISIAPSATETLSFITPSGKPNSDQWEDSGTYIFELEMEVANMQLSAICFAVRLSSSGTILQTGAATASQALQDSRTFNVVAPVWTNGQEACGNRLAIRVDFLNGQSMTNTATIGVGTVVNEVITDLTEDAGTCGGGGAFTLTADVGTFTLTGLATGLKADRQLVAALGSFTLTGIAANLPTGKSIVAALGTFTLTGIAAEFVNDFVMPAALGTFTLTGLATGLKADRQLVAALGTFTLTGVATGLKADRQLSAALGTFALTGIATGLVFGRTIPAALGSFTLTGFATGLVFGRTIPAALGTFTLTGFAATLTFAGAGGDFTLVVDTGSFTLTGFATGLKADRQLLAALATFTLTGIATGLVNGFVLPAALGTFALTGLATGLKADRQLVAALGSFSLTGFAAGLKADRQLVAALGTFTLTGIAANLPTGKGLTADTGTFTLIGLSVNLVADRQLVAALGSFTLTGFAAGLVFGRKLVAALGTFALTGIASGLVFGKTLPAAMAAFVLTGIAAGLAVGRTVTAAVAAFVLTGLVTGLVVGRTLVAVVAAFTLTGIAAGLAVGRTIVAALGSFTLTGLATGLVVGRTLVAVVAAFTLTGFAVTLLKSGSGAFVLTAVVAAFILTGIAIDLLVARTLPPIVTLTSPRILNLTLTSPGIINLNLKGGN